MFTFERNIFINRPQREVFEFITDPTNDAKWRSSNVSAEWSSEGPVGVGSILHSEDKFLGRKIESSSEITTWDPPNQYGQKSVGGPFPYEITLKVAPKENGAQLTIGSQAEFGGFFKLAEGLVGKQFEKQLDADFNALKIFLEEGKE